MKAYILINTEPSIIWEVAEAALKIEGVKMAHAVTGQFDDVVFVEFAKMEELGKILEKIQSVNGVRRTRVLVTVPPPTGSSLMAGQTYSPFSVHWAG